MDPRDFLPDAPGRVIKTLHGYHAYVPDPLPPDIAWSNRILAALSAADRSLARLAEVGNDFPVPHVAARALARQEAVLSSRIEGTRTSFEQLLTYEAAQLSFFGSPADAHEVQNYVRAMDFGLARLGSLPVSTRLIREIHAVLMEGVRGGAAAPGELRRSQNWIGPPGATLNAATFVPPPVEQMADCLSDLERYIHEPSELPPLLRIGMVHVQFEAIHPFIDGNGRAGRLLITLLLVAWGLLDQPLLVLSRYIEANRQEYYARLLAVSREGDWEGWLLFFLEGVRSESGATAAMLARLEALRVTYRESFSGDRSRVNLGRVVDYLIGSPITTITDAQQKLALGSYTTIQRYIEKLAALGIVREVTGRARDRVYRADGIMKELEG